MSEVDYSNFCFGKDLSVIDPDMDLIIRFEEERQARRLILIPSESIAPKPVREALGSVFNNIYAEGWPPLRMTREEERRLLDFGRQLAYYRRYADRRFYKGADYVHFVETLAQRRAAQCFATERVPADAIFVNVQALSGAAANTAVYDALLEPGDTLMGMDLFQGGHLTHGSEFNISGRRYKVVSYGVNRRTERLDYDQIMDLAKKYRPRIIVAGYTSYPWAPDWKAFREIADAVGAYLMADVAHPAGMIVAGVYPNPIEYAHVVTFTTHKTICGPRGAVIMTTDEDIATLIDNAVFPGLQGGPHTNKFAAMAVAFKIAQTPAFRALQQRIVDNAKALAEGLQKRGLRLAYGGTDTHLLLLDVGSIPTTTGFPLRGEMAARILELVGIIVNKNTIPGDEVTALASGIRMGTPWVSQRGMTPEHMDRLAELIARVVTNIQPFRYMGLLGELPRGKIDLDLLEEVKCGVADLIDETCASECAPCGLGYPHYCFLPDNPPVRTPVIVTDGTAQQAALQAAKEGAALLDRTDVGLLRITGERALPFLQEVGTADVSHLPVGHCTRSFLLDRHGKLIDDVTILRLPTDEWRRDRYIVMTNPQNTERVKAWFRALSDGYVLFDDLDIFRKVQGPVIVEDLLEDVDDEDKYMALALHGPQAEEVLRQMAPGLPNLDVGHWHEVSFSETTAIVARTGETHYEIIAPNGQVKELWDKLTAAGAVPAGTEVIKTLRQEAGLPLYDGAERPDGLQLYKNGLQDTFALWKPYFVGQHALESVRPKVEKPVFKWEPPDIEPRPSCLYEEHLKLTKKIIPFAGWKMPVWYTSVSEEHQATRQTAALYDVSHMGVFGISGEFATSFLDIVTANYVRWLDDGQSQYSYLLDVDGNVIDDIMVYRLAPDNYIMVVNAANAEKDWAWLNAVNNGEVLIDRENPARTIEGKAVLKDLKDPRNGPECKVDIALQGPNSREILKRLTDDWRVKDALDHLRRTDVIPHIRLAGLDLVIARTGYTGEDVGYEIFVHPEQAPILWNAILEAGQDLGVKPAGLAARDSTRTEAGLPLYGHELAGPLNISPLEAGFAPYVKFHKPFFIGRKAMLEQFKQGVKRVIVRFQVDRTGARAIRGGEHLETVVNRRGQYIGRVTSCVLVGDKQIGQALVDPRYSEPGTPIAIYPDPGRARPSPKPPSEFDKGDRAVLPEWATVLPRFPEREDRARRAAGE